MAVPHGRGPFLSARPATGARTRPLLDRRRGYHIAFLAVLFAVSAFGYVILQPRTVRVQADGREFMLETNIANDQAVLRGAGIDVDSGDRVTALDGSGHDVLRVERPRRVRLTVDGATYELRTHALTIDQLLDEAGVAITGRDSVLQNGFLASVNAPVDPPMLVTQQLLSGASQLPISLEVRRAVSFTIVEDGREVSSTSSRYTVAQALREAGVTIGPGDAVAPEEQAVLSAGARVEIRHARAMTVALPNAHEVVYTLAPTVGEALDAAGIAVPEDAFIDPPPETAVSGGMSVRVVQLAESSDVEREYIESSTVYREDPSLGAGETRTEEGHDGVLVRRYAIAYVNGEEAGRTLVDEYYEPEPLDTVVYYPPKRATAAARPEDPGAPPDDGNWVSVRVYATWYRPASSGRSAADPNYGVTATGVQVTYGVVAVDPNIIPLGTRMYIPGYGYAVAADTGGAVKGYIIDLGYPDGVTVDWQSRWLDIYILQ